LRHERTRGKRSRHPRPRPLLHVCACVCDACSSCCVLCVGCLCHRAKKTGTAKECLALLPLMTPTSVGMTDGFCGWWPQRVFHHPARDLPPPLKTPKSQPISCFNLPQKQSPCLLPYAAHTSSILSSCVKLRFGTEPPCDRACPPATLCCSSASSAC
jgi:hypothetical protein